MAAVRRLVAQLAVALARDLALVRHQIGGDDARQSGDYLTSRFLVITAARPASAIIVPVRGDSVAMMPVVMMPECWQAAKFELHPICMVQGGHRKQPGTRSNAAPNCEICDFAVL